MILVDSMDEILLTLIYVQYVVNFLPSSLSDMVHEMTKSDLVFKSNLFQRDRIEQIQSSTIIKVKFKFDHNLKSLKQSL